MNRCSDTKLEENLRRCWYTKEGILNLYQIPFLISPHFKYTQTAKFAGKVHTPHPPGELSTSQHLMMNKKVKGIS